MAGRLYQIWNREKTRNFRRWLLGWYGSRKRRLPWRSRPTPYRVWISEVMLQQTQVRTVLPYFERFLRRFPSVKVLAAASEEEVLEQWAGLGYYSRARNLHRAAQRIMAEHRGRLPGSATELAKLPGIGRYTAGAIASIAFGLPHPVVDGNVRRVLCRLHGLSEPAAESFYWRQAESLLPADRASDFNQAMMELGALVCLPRSPRCEGCPVKPLCKTGNAGTRPGRVPRRPARSAEKVEIALLALLHGDEVLLSRRGKTGFIPGEWGLPAVRLEKGEMAPQAAAAFAKRLLGREIALSECPPIRHSITWRRLQARVFSAALKTRRWFQVERDGLRWCHREELPRVLTSSLYTKALKRTEG